ncbi:MAG TPA: protocatechuate 3,4-dioxygenase subunit alpha [Bryobacteraceae bacterium]|nr:protocatechuate 3,4-dioxygenase subunit alpha [Bryobacteraceae bacterium]
MIPSPYSTIGPFYLKPLIDGCDDLTRVNGRHAAGQHILLTGRVMEEGSAPVLNSVLEIWQPDANGIFRHPLDPRHGEADPGFFGWGRTRSDKDGRYQFRTVLPGSSREESGTVRCPHINLMVLAIGLTRRLVTTVFFGDAPEITRDPVLQCVGDSAARRRLFAVRDAALDAGGIPAYRFDIVLRGENETPFFLD